MREKHHMIIVFSLFFTYVESHSQGTYLRIVDYLRRSAVLSRIALFFVPIVLLHRALTSLTIVLNKPLHRVFFFSSFCIRFFSATYPEMYSKQLWRRVEYSQLQYFFCGEINVLLSSTVVNRSFGLMRYSNQQFYCV